MPTRTIHGACRHLGRDNAIAPVMTVAPGTAIEFECLDASGGQLTPTSTVADVATLGDGPDLMTAAREAVARMVDMIAARTGMAAVDAYMLSSVCGDLHISEIVDQPNWVVGFYFPRLVLE
ncbi:MAG: putative formamidase [Phenylobacterium sp.]|nr:putative formamidase [Phenylobacterium sp.]